MPKDCHPSPARYTLPPTVGYSGHDIRKNRLPAFSFGLKTHERDQIGSPAPNAYGLPPIIGGRDITKDNAPAHSLHAKLHVNDHHVSPGPNIYGLQNFKPGERAPAFSMGARIKDIETQEC